MSETGRRSWREVSEKKNYVSITGQGIEATKNRRKKYNKGERWGEMERAGERSWWKFDTGTER